MKIIDYIQQGGFIMYILLLFNIVGFTIMLAKFYILNREKSICDKNADSLKEKILNEIQNEHNSGIIIEMAKKEISSYMLNLERGINTVKIIGATSPLLGLLGTVVGVLIAFQVMSKEGLNNPEHFAQGISLALITTVGGLIVAIPHYIGHSYMLGMLDRIETNIEKKLLIKLL